MARIKVKNIFLGFENKELERQFISKTHEPQFIRALLIVGSLSYAFFFIIDYILYKEYYNQLLVIRCGVFMPTVAVLLFLSFTPCYQKIANYMTTIASIAGAGTIMAIEYLTRTSVYSGTYFYGVLIVLLFFYGTGKTKLSISLISSFIIVIPTLHIEAAYIENDPNHVMLKSVFLIMMIVVGNLTGGIIQFTARTNFLNQRRIEELSMTDFLTGLRNRLYFNNIIRKEITAFIEESETNNRLNDNDEKKRYGLMLLDIDSFKKINDNNGHEVGDLLLQEFCSRVSKIIRSDDVFIRWGGDEFLLLIRYTYKSTITELAKRIKSETSKKLFNLKNNQISATVSGGVISIPPKSVNTLGSIEEIINRADKALYSSKNGGRNMFTEYIITDINKSAASFKTIS